jgi:murein DD-endopeptidase MepM/ murein hydrolase activator NlpD
VAEIEALNPGVEAKSLRVGMEIQIPRADDSQASGTETGIPEDSESRETETGQSEQTPEEDAELWPHRGDRRTNERNHVRWVQISGDRGDDIVSVASGRVVWCAPYTVYRKVVIIEAADTRTNEAYRFWYAGNEEVYVRSGDWVEKGTVIASMGVDPFDGAPRVSFAVTKGLKVVDHTLYSWQ